jgi:hypothetical protein
LVRDNISHDDARYGLRFALSLSRMNLLRLRILIHILILILLGSPAMAKVFCQSLFSASAVVSREDLEAQISLKDLSRRSLDRGLIELSSPVLFDESISNASEFTYPFPNESKFNFPFLTESENLEKTAYPYQRNLFLGASMLPVRGAFLNPKVVFNSASLNFLANGHGASRAVKFFIETEKTQQLSKQQGLKIRYELAFNIPPQTDWVSLRFSDFKLSTVLPDKKSSLLSVNQTFLKIGMDISSKDEKEIEFSPQAFFSLDVGNKDLDQLIDNIYLNHQSVFYFKMYGPRPSDLEIKKTLKEFFSNMQNPENQKYSTEVVIQGSSAIEKELKQYGWTAKTKLTKKVKMLNIIEALNKKDLFFEAGDFGPIHGKFAHHAQILAGLHGLPMAKATLILDFISKYIADVGQFSQWTIWNVLFDSRGQGVNGNRFWRDQIRTKQ